MREEGGGCLSAIPVPQNERTPLHLAAEEGHEVMVEKLLAAGGKKEAKDKVTGELGKRVEYGEGSRGSIQLLWISSLLVAVWFRCRLCGHF